MSSDSSILTDSEMTVFVVKHTKGDAKKRQKIRYDWLDFTLFTIIQKKGDRQKFVEAVNQWLRKHKILINVISIELIDEDDGECSIYWTVQETK